MTDVGNRFIRPGLLEALDAGRSPAWPDGDTGEAPAQLAARMAEVYGVDPANLAAVEDVAAAGDLLVRLFRRPDADEAVLIASKGAAAARATALLHGARLVDLTASMRSGFDVDALKSQLDAAVGDALVFIAAPSYETGEAVDPELIAQLARQTPNALWIVDETFVEFAETASLAPRAAAAENLVALRSLSQAYGLAEAPCAALIANAQIADVVRRAASLRPLNRAMIALAAGALEPTRMPVAARRIAQTKTERARMTEALAGAPQVAKVFPGAANFVALEIDDAEGLARLSKERGIRIDIDAAGDPPIARASVRAPADNDLLLDALGIDADRPPARVAEVSRETKETKIAARVDLDGAPGAIVSTGIGYFDHMLEQVAKHGGFDLVLTCQGDTHVDAHHTIEDCMLTLGTLLKEALGEKRGVRRFGFKLPMDETEAEALIDLSGRPYAVFEGVFAASHVGEYPTEMTAHAFRSLAETLGAAIHVKVQGENDHHKTEACFKAFGRAFRDAIRREDGVRGDDLPSTKGAL